MTNHTPKPWQFSKHEPVGADVFDDEHGIYPPLGEAGPVALASSEQDARRIAAAVNACAGIATEDLEAMADGSFVPSPIIYPCLCEPSSPDERIFITTLGWSVQCADCECDVLGPFNTEAEAGDAIRKYQKATK